MSSSLSSSRLLCHLPLALAFHAQGSWILHHRQNLSLNAGVREHFNDLTLKIVVSSDAYLINDLTLNIISTAKHIPNYTKTLQAFYYMEASISSEATPAPFGASSACSGAETSSMAEFSCAIFSASILRVLHRHN
ncbi:hypothetical protein L3X38_039584 [Prunus dulcis]|uniref:Uncharacterized protein n=1 Tax=Prunus dulcis TaxID=3755 RepID=A0AAD4V9K3_PRUDU|nr:hypothetical protein L3X38_039584 [Prunus dulcis]